MFRSWSKYYRNMQHVLLYKDKKLLCLTEIYNSLSIITQRNKFYQMAKKMCRYSLSESR